MPVKALFLAAWILVLVLQARNIAFLGVLYILAVFLYHYRPGIGKITATTIVWYWVTGTVTLFVWVRYRLWLAAWVHIFVTWFAPVILTSIMPFQEPRQSETGGGSMRQ